MSIGEPKPSIEGISLREYIDTRFEHILLYDKESHELRDKAIEARFKSLENAVELAREVLGTRLETTNEWRKTVDDILKTAVTQDTYNGAVGRLQLDIIEAKAIAAGLLRQEEFERVIDNLEKDIHELQLSRATLAGKAEQSTVNVFMIITIIGMLMSAINILYMFFGK